MDVVRKGFIHVLYFKNKWFSKGAVLIDFLLLTLVFISILKDRLRHFKLSEIQEIIIAGLIP